MCRLRPRPLSQEAVRTLASERLGTPVEDAFAAECHRISGGVPFLVHELLAAVIADGLPGTGATAGRISGLGSHAIAQAALVRPGARSPHAPAVGRAVAVLGRYADTRRVAALAGVDASAVLEGVDALVATNVLTPGDPLTFTHPILRSAVHEDMGVAERSSAHARAARLLVDEGAPLAEAATHLLFTEPGTAPRAIELLRGAAEAAGVAGAPAEAATYLRRALADAEAADLRAELLYALGVAGRAAGDARAVADLEEALRLERDPWRRAAIARDLGELLAVAGATSTAVELCDAALAELGDRDRELSIRLETVWAGAAFYGVGHYDAFNRRHARLRELAMSSNGPIHPLAFLLAAAAAVTADRPGDVVALIERGSDAEFLGTEEGAVFAPQALVALASLEELDRFEALMADLVDKQATRGSVFAFLVLTSHRALLYSRRGQLAAAEAALRGLFSVAGDHELLFAIAAFSALHYAVEALVERPSLADLAALAETLDTEVVMPRPILAGQVLEVRGRVRLGGGDIAGAVEALRGSAEAFASAHCLNPNHAGWRPWLAIALRGSDPAEARRLATDAVALARELGLARAHGVALRALGLVTGGHDGIDLLHAALAELEKIDAPFERARTFVELGSALRRANRRRDAREPLRTGLELARRCGADRLQATAFQELKATGARPRALVLTGVDSLTPSEDRVARMAARGMSNPEIGQALFVTLNTVEGHLRQVYRKLDITSRKELPSVLEAAAPGERASPGT